MITLVRHLFTQQNCHWLIPAQTIPQKLRPPAMALFSESLSKGLTLLLLRLGGWQHQRTMTTTGDIIAGRLWQRHTSPDWHFTPFSFQFCRWLAQTELDETNHTTFTHLPQTIADECLLWVAIQQLPITALLKLDAVRHSFLPWLTHPQQLGQYYSTIPATAYKKLPPLLTHSLVLEALQQYLTQQWFQLESEQCQIENVAHLKRTGKLKKQVLTYFCQQLAKQQRQDLIQFLLTAMQQWLQQRPETHDIIFTFKSLTTKQHLQAHHAASEVLAILPQLQQWQIEAQQCRFFDDHYDQAQYYLNIWEPLAPHYPYSQQLLATFRRYEEIT